MAVKIHGDVSGTPSRDARDTARDYHLLAIDIGMSKAFAFDLDGVLIRGGRALDGAKRSLELLNRNRIPWIFLTNGGGHTEADRVKILTDQLDVPVHSNQFLQSHTPFRDFVGSKDRVLVVGGPDDRCRKIAEGYGFKDVVIPADLAQTDPKVFAYPTYTASMPGARPLVNVDKPFDAIFVFHDSRDITADSQIVLDLLLSDKGRLGTRRLKHDSKPSVPIYFSNGDMQWATEFAVPRLGQGALVSIIAKLYNEISGHPLEHTVIGKPTLLTYEYADRLLKGWADQIQSGPIQSVYMIGDNQYSDILGANNFGWESALLRTGVYQDTDELFTKPTIISDDVLSAVEHILNE